MHKHLCFLTVPFKKGKIKSTNGSSTLPIQATQEAEIGSIEEASLAKQTKQINNQQQQQKKTE
jgi:hypothetical protein